MTRVTATMVEIAAADGTADCLFAHPAADGPHAGVVLYTDAFGIRTAVRQHVARLAGHGYAVLAPNLFYRQRPAPVLDDIDRLVGGDDRGSLFAALRPMLDALTAAAGDADARAWVEFLEGRGEIADGSIGTVGYCLGGRLALRTAGLFPDRVAAAASFHGARLATDGPDSPHLVAVRAGGELYVGHADNDASMEPEQMGRLTQALAEAHVRHTCELYTGARHGWTQTDTPVYDEASAERHWRRLLDLFGRTLTA